MGKSGTIDKFFKRKIPNQLDSPNSTAQSIASDDNLPPEVESQKFRKVENIRVDLNLLERDPRLRRQIWEYSPNEQEEIRRAYLNLKPSGCPKQTAFTVDGFDNWKKVRSGKTCSFQCHIGKDNVSSPHRIAEKACDDLMNQPRHIQRFFDKVSSETVARNRLRLKVGIHVVRLLALQGVPFRGHDESSNSSNRGNFLEFLDIVALYNDELSCAIEKAPKNAKYTCHDIQKQIIHMFSIRMKNIIREEIAGSKYCIVVDEARDESKREQLSIVLRYDSFDINECYIFCKRNDELKEAHTDDIAHLISISINELETGRGLNQLCTLQRAADTRWSSHFRFVSSLIKMFSASCTVLFKVMEDGLPSQRADATSVYDEMTSFDFVFILHLMREIMEITDVLCQNLQRKSQDILNAMELVSSTQKLLQELRDDKWDDLLEKVKSFLGEVELVVIKAISPLSIIIG
ncbi:uncharacterized protein [Primulina eburnea]|uniref:uncharacterized protein n=1 Tax=Primulina eburnea TaxID=1245227 RepID=UPI003C6BFADD